MTKLPLTDDFTDPVEVRRSAFLFLACVLILLGIGSVMVYSASATVTAEAAHDRAVAGDRVVDVHERSLAPIRSHGLKVLLGVGLLIAAARIDYRLWLRWSKPFYIVALVLLALVLVPGIGAKINGARRWFQFDALPFALQPSEFAKLALIVFLSAFIARTPQLDQSFRRGLLPGVIAVLIPSVLILVETDVGTCLLVSMLGISLLVMAGARILHLVLMGLAAVPLLAYFMVTRPYVMQRFQGFTDPDPTSQVGFGLSAMSVGGLTGMGLGGGRYKLFYLAEGENDFILSVIGEELGFLGTTAVVMLFAILLWSGGRILLGVRNRFGFFLVAGVLLTIAMQALINLAVATGSVPVKGMPLPFVSAGGSSLTVLCLAVGLVLSVARNPDHPSVMLAEGGSGEGRGSE